MSDTDKVLITASQHILTMTFNRPEKLNALDPESYHLLAQALHRLQHDNDLRVGIIQANGKHFSAGLELDKWAPLFAQGQALTVAAGEIDPYGIAGEMLTKPLVIAAQGLCYTSGLELLLNTDIRLATAETRFAQLEVQRGIYPCGGGTVRLPEEIGWARAQRYLLTGDEFSGQQAYDWGMLTELCEAEQLQSRARELALKVAAAAPLGVQAALKSAKTARLHGDSAALAQVFADMAKIMRSDDAAEGVRSFMERRAAMFKGR